MKRFLLLLALVANIASAQFVVLKPGQQPVPVAPVFAMPPGKIYVNTATIPKSRVGLATERARESGCTRVGGVPSSGDCANTSNDAKPGATDGAFRIACPFDHASFDDPIVWPGQPGKTHAHVFFGNRKTSSGTDLDQMATSGNSSCAGGILNRTGYWTPTLIYHRPGNSRNGEFQVPSAAVFYYKSFGSGQANVVWPQPAHRMIAGDPNSTGAQPGVVRYDCLNPSTGLTQAFLTIPTTAQATALGAGNCQEVIMLVAFPECHDGLSLGGILGKGHMAYKSPAAACTDPNFPIQFPLISFNIHWTVRSLADLDYMRLSSDQPATSGYPAGHSGHADWVNGYKSTAMTGTGEVVTNMILRNCIKVLNDCHANVLGPTIASPNRPWILY